MLQTQLPFNIETERFGNLQWVDPFRNRAALEIVVQEIGLDHGLDPTQPPDKRLVGLPVRFYLASRTTGKWTLAAFKEELPHLTTVIKQMLAMAVTAHQSMFDNVEVRILYEETQQEIASFTYHLPHLHHYKSY